MKRMTTTVAALAAFYAHLGAAQAQPAAPKAAAPATCGRCHGAAGKALYPQSQFDVLLKERLAQGQPVRRASRERHPRGAQHARAADARGEEGEPRQER